MTKLTENAFRDVNIAFANELSVICGKLGIDATNKLPPETEREWGRPMAMDPAVSARIDALWPSLGLASEWKASR